MTTDEMVRLTRRVWEAEVQDWLNNDILTWHWFLALTTTLVLIAAWWKLVDRNRLMEISFYGLIINVTATLFDSIGVSTGQWTYPNRLVPLSIGLMPANYFVIPIIFMFTYQYFRSWKSYIIAWVILGAVLSFITDPLLIKINYYELVRWKNAYSFPVYIGMAIFARLLTEFFVKKNVN